jgi:hypothetical protein
MYDREVSEVENDRGLKDDAYFAADMETFRDRFQDVPYLSIS